jgi:hypothetical protein
VSLHAPHCLKNLLLPRVVLYVWPVVLVFLLAGCVSKREADMRQREGFLAGQQQAQADQARAAQKGQPPTTVTVIGKVKNGTVPWTEDMTVAQAIVAADYQGWDNPKRIEVTHNGELIELTPHQLLHGGDFPVEPGDTIKVIQ